METIQPITQNEIKIAQRFYWVLIPVVLVVGLISYVLLNTTSLPNLPKYAGLVIAWLAVIIFFSTSFKIIKDIKLGDVIEVTGNLDRKKKMGGGKSLGQHHNGRTKSAPKSQTAYLLDIDGKRYWVKAKHYSKVKENTQVKMRLLPNSQLVLGIETLNT